MIVIVGSLKVTVFIKFQFYFMTSIALRPELRFEMSSQLTDVLVSQFTIKHWTSKPVIMHPLIFHFALHGPRFHIEEKKIFIFIIKFNAANNQQCHRVYKDST